MPHMIFAVCLPIGVVSNGPIVRGRGNYDPDCSWDSGSAISVISMPELPIYDFGVFLHKALVLKYKKMCAEISVRDLELEL